MRRDSEVLRHCFNSAGIRRLYTLQGLQMLGNCRSYIWTLSLFDICGIITSSTKNYFSLSGIRHHHELMRFATPDSAGICFHNPKGKSATGKNIAIGHIHFMVTDLQVLFIQVKRIKVFHDKLSSA